MEISREELHKVMRDVTCECAERMSTDKDGKVDFGMSTCLVAFGCMIAAKVLETFFGKKEEEE